jgi:DNA (cytosine-5)-methyltransferase 1
MAGGIGFVNRRQYTIKTRVKLDSPCPTVQTHGNLKTFNELSLPIESVQALISRDTGKPPYRVPSMAEIAAIPWNGRTVVSTFSGGGGSSTGYRMAGFRILWASEFIDAARDTYLFNAAPSTIIDGRDIRDVTPDEILSAIGMSAGELDIFDGSPPCASFSTAGKRNAGWGKIKKYSDKEQRTDDLFFEYIRLLRGLNPKVFIAENVSGLIKGVAKGYFLEILAALKACGYRVTCRVLDAQWLGVPQARQRTIFIGVREDLNLDPVHPKALTYRYSVRDALPWIVRQGDTGGFGRGTMKNATTPSPIIGAGPTTGNRNYAPSKVEAETDISRYAIGAEWEKMGNPGTQSNKYYQLQRPSINKACPTVTFGISALSCAGVVHPTEKRRFSIAELKRICAFPDDYILTGTYAQQWERMGRAVPPLMMKAIAETVRDKILARIK